MAFSNLSPRFLIKTLKLIGGRSKLINEYRVIQWNSLQSTTSIKFENYKTREIRRTCKCFSSKIAIQDETKEFKSKCSYVSSFQKQMQFRQKQAQCSVLIELMDKNSISSATSACEEFGVVKSAFSYSGESKNVFVLIEFACEESVNKLLLNCGYKNISDAFPTLSRIIRFNELLKKSTPKTTVSEEEVILQSVKSKGKTVSELIELIYVTEKLSELDTRLRFFFCQHLKEALHGIFPHCDALPFGSSVNGFGKQGCDLDIMLRLYPSQVVENSEFYFLNKTCVGNGKDLQKRAIHALSSFFRTFLPGVNSLQTILHARVPIMKFNHAITGMDCDISVNNMSAILMSDILYFCGEVDTRVRPLLYAVKKWAKEANVTRVGPGAWITNFGLSLLVIFFLQNRPIPILPGLIEALQIVGEETAPNFGVEYLTPIIDLQTKASLNTESLAILLKEFLNYLGSHPFENKHISVLTGKVSTQQNCEALWVQYPVEEDKNVTKNVSHSYLYDLCEKARLSHKFIANNMGVKCGDPADLQVILGVSQLKKVFQKKSSDLDFSIIFNEKYKNKRNSHKR